MSLYMVTNEYDMDLAIKECIRLVAMDGSTIKLAFNNMDMVNIFMLNLNDKCDQHHVDPEAANFRMDVLVQATKKDEGDSTSYDG